MNPIFKTILFVLVILFSILSLNANANANETAKPWTLKTQNGDVISLAQYKNRPVILHFWATWCPYCKKIQYQVLIEKYKLVLNLKKYFLAKLKSEVMISFGFQNFMKNYECIGIPFYIVYGPAKPEGLILPVLISYHDIFSSIKKVK